MRISHYLRLSVLLPILLAACASPAASSAPRVTFTTPVTGATVSSPVHVTWAAENFTVEPAGEVNPGAGHLHIMVDTACVAPGELIINDDQHLHFGKAQMETDLELAPGQHTLCLQAADGAHTALSGDGLTQTISITVQ